MYNKVILVGNLSRDLELRYLPSGSAVCNTAIATNRKFKKQDGSFGEEVCFIDITFFGRTAEVANQYLKRGSKILVEGRLKLDQWTDQTGGKRSKHSVVVDSMQMLDTKGSQPDGDNSFGNNTSAGSGYGQNNYGGGVNNSSNYGQNNNYNQNYNQAQNMPKNEPQPNPNMDIPDIDVNDDEIPF
ncbi:MAG: single-stranded DNA-binding protein [Campylobacteraceae bacterium]|nr:single-stranded DNA-binding protein [Campylobacteraceae bacterium]